MTPLVSTALFLTTLAVMTFLVSYMLPDLVSSRTSEGKSTNTSSPSINCFTFKVNGLTGAYPACQVWLDPNGNLKRFKSNPPWNLTFSYDIGGPESPSYSEFTDDVLFPHVSTPWTLVTVPDDNNAVGGFITPTPSIKINAVWITNSRSRITVYIKCAMYEQPPEFNIYWGASHCLVLTISAQAAPELCGVIDTIIMTASPSPLPTSSPSAVITSHYPSPSRLPLSSPSFKPSNLFTYFPSDHPSASTIHPSVLRPSPGPSRNAHSSTSKPTFIPSAYINISAKSPSLSPAVVQSYIDYIPQSTTKRGSVNNGKCGDIVGKNVAWFYNYKMTRIPTYVDIPRPYVQDPVSIPFVPMVKSRDCITRLLLNRTFDGVVPEVLLGFNEPDGPIVNISVQEALQLWPILESTKATRLGSPACMRKSIDKWLPFFMNGNGTYKPRVDFIQLHWYEVSAKDFLAFIDFWYSVYKLPIWVTEFSFADWLLLGYSVDHVKTFIKEAVQGLENRPFVERYAWYSNPCVSALRHASLWTPVGSTCSGVGAQLNELGYLYFNYSSTSEPSRLPTLMPTVEPSLNIDIPTVKPSEAPTKWPTLLPPC